MPISEKHAPGSFCWMELRTTDQDAGKQFYSSLFGWEVMDIPMGPAGVYTIFRLQGKDCAAACTVKEHEPPNWAIYIATDNVDESTGRVTELGGKVLMEPFDVPPSGRMSVVLDPSNVCFCLWQANLTAGIGILNENNAFCWADLNTPDRAGAKEFYSGMFGWTFVTGKDATGKEKDESGYWHIMNGGHGIGGVPPVEYQPRGVPPHWLLYYQVADCRAMTAKAKELGARVLMEPTTIEGQLMFSVVADPQGAAFALFQPGK